MIDAGRYYGTVIGAAIRCYLQGNLLRDIAALYIEQGEHYLSQVQGGIFESIVLREDADNEDQFYVYRKTLPRGRIKCAFD